MAELRAAAGLRADAGDLPVHPARLRARTGVPTAWDDIPRALDRSWKRQRATRWKITGRSA